MTTVQVLVVGPDHEFREGGAGARRLWYFGSDYARYLELCAAAGSDAMAPAGDLPNAVARRLAGDLIDLDTYLATGRFSVSWLSSDLAERNPYTSSFCLDLCRTIALLEAARAGGYQLVVVDDPSFGRALVEVCRDNGIMAWWQGRRRFAGGASKALRAHLAFVLGYVRQWRALRLYPADPMALAGRSPWLMSWAEGSAGGVGPIGDRFLGQLADWLRDDGLAIGWLLNPAAWLRPIGAIAATVRQSCAREPSVLAGQFFDLRVLVRAYGSLLTLPFAVKRRFILDGLDLTRLVRLAVAREIASPRLVAAALYASLAGRLKRRDLAPRTLVYTYENQPWEKAMIAGFRRALPATRLIGVQHAPLAERYFSGHPSHRQWADGSVPDLLVTIGLEFRRRLLSLGAPEDRVVVGGALRHVDLLARPGGLSPHRAQDARMVLASCTMDPRDSYELAHKAVVATADLPGVRLAVNFHPMAGARFRNQIVDRLSRLVDCRHVEFVEGAAADWLPRADILLYNSSSTAFEAAAIGVPLIYVASDVALDLDTMAGADIPRARRPLELRRHIEILLSDPERRRVAVASARDHLSQCLSVPRPQFWAALVRQETARDARQSWCDAPGAEEAPKVPA